MSAASLRTNEHLNYLRNTVYFVQSEPVEMAGDIIEDDIAGKEIQLDGLYDGLEAGRWIVVSGERTDIKDKNELSLPGIRSSELAMISGVEQRPDGSSPGDTPHTFITLHKPLAYSYKRSTVKLYGNVAKASHGETVPEVLGSSNASVPFARFALKRPPLTYVPAPTTSGVLGTETVRVNGVRYTRVDSLLDATGEERVYEVTVDETGTAILTFGDGVRGARLPSGQENVRATYRVGIGAAGNVRAEQISLLTSRYLGVNGVINPLRASGGAERDGPERIRRNTPLAAQSLSPISRLLSVPDYAAFARRFAGIGHANARKLTNGSYELVHMTVAGVDNIPLDPEGVLLTTLEAAYQQYGDPAFPVVIEVRELVALVLQAKVAIKPDAEWDIKDQLRRRLFEEFSFEKRGLGRPAFLSEAIAVMQATPGVDRVDIDIFGGISETELRDPEALDAAVKKLGPSTVVPSMPAILAADDPERAKRRNKESERKPRFLPAQIAFLVPDVTGTLVLNLIT